MSIEEHKLLSRRSFEELPNNENVAAVDERYAASEHEALERKAFRLTLAIATEPSKLAQVRQMLVHLREQREVPDPEDFSAWALGQIDDRVMSLALEYAHDAEIILQLLSFKDGTFGSLMHDIEDLYRQEKISQRVYVKAKLLLRTVDHNDVPR